MKETIRLLGNVLEQQPLSSDEATGLLKLITDYSYALDVLDQYDHQILEIHNITKEELFVINYHVATQAIQGLREKFGGSSLFENEKDESSRVRWQRYTKLSAVSMFIPASKKRQLNFYTL